MTDRSRDPAMTPERWQRVEQLVDGALDRPATERAAWLNAECAGDEALRHDVQRLLDAIDAPNALLGDDTPSFVNLVATVEHDATLTPRTTYAVPARIGAWRIVASAGEGGMGAVFAVERDDGAYRLRAALKIVRPGLHLDSTFVRRFRDERQILARLDHPNIARLLDGGVTDDGRPYYVMEFVDGAPIDRWCNDRQATIEARLVLFAKVCDAVADAHARDIVHRDLKPSNVLVTAQGDPKLLDFGIAKTLAPLRYTSEHAAASPDGKAHSTLTRTGERLLTPEYASPEQIRGEAVTPATDVYALGVLLYELLTGQRPYHGRDRSRHEIERAILEEAPTRPSAITTRPLSDDLRRRLRGDLDTIVLAALRKEPERRYAGAAELAADIRRHLEGRPVRARGDSPAYRTRMWIARHRTTATSGVVGVALGLSALAVFRARGEESSASRVFSENGLAYEVSTRSPVAVRYYADGLRAHARGNWGDATRLFIAALREDSTFAMAASYGSDAAQRDEDYNTARRLLDQSVRHAFAASERERYLVHLTNTLRLRSRGLAEYVDSLSRRFPGSKEAVLWRGRAAMSSGDWPTAVGAFRELIDRDSASADNLVPCVTCEARVDLVSSYLFSDSLLAAEREARELTRLQPTAASSWQMVALVQSIEGSTDESAYRRRVELEPSDADYAVEVIADRRLRQGEFAAADELLRGRMETAPPGREERSMGLLIKSLRMQERWPEALALARRFRATDSTSSPDALHPVAVPEAQILFESGRVREAAAIFDSVSRWPLGAAGGNRSWQLTHMAAALAAARDTTALAMLADSVRALAPTVGYGRDARLHHHIDGLRLVALGRDGEAVDAFRRAIFSWNMGYTRTNLELGRALMRLGRPAEAVAALQPALRGSLEVNNSYVTHTELRRVLAEAWRAAGNTDSADVHARWVRSATRR